MVYQTLQKLLSLYHPQKDRLYFEFDPAVEAIDEVVKETYDDIRDDVNGNLNKLILDLNKGYKSLQGEFNSIFN